MSQAWYISIHPGCCFLFGAARGSLFTSRPDHHLFYNLTLNKPSQRRSSEDACCISCKSVAICLLLCWIDHVLLLKLPCLANIFRDNLLPILTDVLSFLTSLSIYIHHIEGASSAIITSDLFRHWVKRASEVNSPLSTSSSSEHKKRADHICHRS